MIEIIEDDGAIAVFASTRAALLSALPFLGADILRSIPDREAVRPCWACYVKATEEIAFGLNRIADRPQWWLLAAAERSPDS